MSVPIISWLRLAVYLKVSEREDCHLFHHHRVAPYHQHPRMLEIHPPTRVTTPPLASARVRRRHHARSPCTLSHPLLASTPKLCRLSTMSSRAAWNGSATRRSSAGTRAKPFFKPSASSHRNAACPSARLPKASGRVGFQASRTSRNKVANGAKSVTRAWPRRCDEFNTPILESFFFT
jgi:hypothetical protein